MTVHSQGSHRAGKRYQKQETAEFTTAEVHKYRGTLQSDILHTFHLLVLGS